MKNLVHNLWLIALVFVGATLCTPAQECYTPLEWIPKNHVWNMDRNKNFVDDEIDAMPAGSIINVLICLNACAEEYDINRLAAYGGTIGYRSKYISIIEIKDISTEAAIKLGQDERVAMVELERESQPTLDVSMPAAKIRTSTTYSGANVEDIYPSIDGSGVTIAIIDSGVDNLPASATSGTVHNAFPAWKYVAGYDAINDIETDPDDMMGHGTHVAGIALGTQATYRGAAPGAQLVDIQIFATGGASDAVVLASFDKVIQRRVAWGIDIVNMSFGKGIPSDGTDAISQAANRIVREGIFVAVAAGNCGCWMIGPPGSADFAMTVASAYDQGTVTRTDDAISWFSSYGPRNNDGDGITEDEQKPDITAYGENIHSAQNNTTNANLDLSGTSMATPQVAGLAALILEANPGMDPLSVKKLIERTAEDFGAPGWDANFGHGIINAYQAITEVVLNAQTDVAFDVYCWKPGSPAWYLSPDLYPSNPSVIEGSTNAIVVTIKNLGSIAATNFHVRCGIYSFSNSTADFDICMHHVPSLAAGATLTFSCPWVPEANGLTPSVVHACLKAYIIYPNDTDPSNNCAQHNVDIVQTHSPATFTMTVVNPTGEEAQMRVVTDPPEQEIEDRGWKLNINDTDREFTMPAVSCPRTIKIELEAIQAGEREQMPVRVAIQGVVNGEERELGGMQIVGENHNGTPRPPDVKLFDGIRHTALGQARLNTAPDVITATDIGPDGNDGVSVWLDQAEFWQGWLRVAPDAMSDGNGFTVQAIGETPGAVASQLSLVGMGDRTQLTADFMVPNNALTVEVYDNNQLIAVRQVSDLTFANVGQFVTAYRVTPYQDRGGRASAEFAFEDNVEIELLAPPFETVSGDRIIVTSNLPTQRPAFIQRVDVTGVNVGSFGLADEAGGAFGRAFHAMGNPALIWEDGGKALTASRIKARSAIGARAEVPSLRSYKLIWEPVEIVDQTLGASLSVAASGIVNGEARDIGSLTGTYNGAAIALTADLRPLNSPVLVVTVYSDGNPVYSSALPTVDIGWVDSWPVRAGAVIDESNTPGLHFAWDGDREFTLSDGSVVSGNELRVAPEEQGQAEGITSVGVYAVGPDRLRIIGEDASENLQTSVDLPGAPLPFSLYQNYPNPFDQRTVFKFDLFTSAFVELEVYNMLGERVAGVVARDFARGTHEVEWKRTQASLPSGTYIYKIKVRPAQSQQTFELQRKMVVLD